MALTTAHTLLPNVLDLQKEHFKLNALEEPLKRCSEDLQEIWERAKVQVRPA